MRALVDPVALTEEVEAKAREGLRLVSLGPADNPAQPPAVPQQAYSAVLGAPMESSLVPMSRWMRIPPGNSVFGVWSVRRDTTAFVSPFRFRLFGFFVTVFPPDLAPSTFFTTVPAEANVWVDPGMLVQVGHLSVTLPIHLVTA